MFWSRTERGMKAELRLQQHPYDTESWGVPTREAQVQGSCLVDGERSSSSYFLRRKNLDLLYCICW